MQQTRSARTGSPCTAGYLGLVLIVGTGCPQDQPGRGGDSGESGETGGSGDPEPIDPFDGDGDDPPGDVDLTLIYQPPSSLGNGLVHDSRYDLMAETANTYVSSAQLANGVVWASFVPAHADKLRVGFRPTQVDAIVRLNTVVDGMSVLSVDDRSVYVCDDDANYRTVTKTYVFSDLATEQALAASGPSPAGQPRPTAIDSFVLGSGQFGVHIVWTYDNSPMNWKLVVGQSAATFITTLANLAHNGFRPNAISGRQRHGASEYAAIFVQDGVPEEDWRVMLVATRCRCTIRRLSR